MLWYVKCVGNILYYVQVIRDMLNDMGCVGTLPRNEKDTIDMMRVLQELTYSSAERRGDTTVLDIVVVANVSLTFFECDDIYIYIYIYIHFRDETKANLSA